MIERIRLCNFQKHEDTRITFDPHVTTFVGPNDIGKSSILRAIRWVMTNKPSGVAFIRDGQNQCKVLMRVDGKSVVRAKGRKGSYIATKGMGGTSSDRRTYKAFGSDLPEPIIRFFNVGNVNFQRQHEQPFWFCLTAGQVSRELNAVVNLDEIDRSLAELSRRVKKARSEVGFCEERVVDIEKEREALLWVPKMSEEWLALCALKNKAKTVASRVKQMQKMLEATEKLRKEVDIEVPDISKLERLRSECFALTRKKEDWVSILEKVEEDRTRAIQLAKELDRMENDLVNKMGGVCPLCGGPMKKTNAS